MNPRGFFSWETFRTCGTQILLMLAIMFTLFGLLYLILRR